MQVGEVNFPLWSDEPTSQDLLSFKAVAATVVDAILDNDLDPIALGLSGAWGSGKTTVLELVKSEIEKRTTGQDRKALVVSTQPWRYDPTVGPKESIISEVLAALDGAMQEGVDDQARSHLKSLVKRVNWSKAVKVAAKTSLTLQLPSADDLVEMVNDGSADELGNERGLAQFHEEFSKLLKSDALKHISRVVVLVDDLDRCLPEAVVDTLEAIRLFLSAQGMSFVIAADEDRVADAIQERFKTPPATADGETPAKLYLHKIVQTTIPLPGLSRFDTQAYLFLLLSRSQLSADVFQTMVDACDTLRQAGKSLDDLPLTHDARLAGSMATASRLTPILYEKFRGNPRRIKRFLNDLNVRQAVASRRGIELPSDAVAKLMVLERLLVDDFRRVLEWLAANQLRDRLQALEMLANQPEAAAPPEGLPTDAERSRKAGDADKPVKAKRPDVSDDSFSDTLVRWAKLPPSLDATAVSGYLYLAASFARIEVLDTGLPERLRDLAAGLTSSLKLDRVVVSDDNLRALSESDAQLLVTHIGRQTRDQPTIQKYSVEGVLRIAKIHPGSREAVVTGLKGLPVNEVEPATALKLRGLDAAIFGPVIEIWEGDGASPELRRTAAVVRKSWEQPRGH